MNSNSEASSLRFIFSEQRLLNRNSPDLILVEDKGELGLDIRIVFLGGLGPIGDIGVTGLGVGPVMTQVSNSAPSENEGASHACLFRAPCWGGVLTSV